MDDRAGQKRKKEAANRSPYGSCGNGDCNGCADCRCGSAAVDAGTKTGFAGDVHGSGRAADAAGADAFAPYTACCCPGSPCSQYTVQTEQKASCTAPGVLRYVCDCGEEYTESIPMTDHTPEIIPAVEATCQATGLTEGERCSVCGEILVPQKETEKLPHTLKKKWGAYPTCTTPGYTSELSCTVCGEVVQKSKLLPATHHANAVTYPGSASTCITRGHTESTY